MCPRIDLGRPIAHVAAEARVSRRCLAKWYARWLAYGDAGLTDRSSRSAASPQETAPEVADLIETVRRQTKQGPVRIAATLARTYGITIAPSTVHRVLVRRGLSRLQDLDPPSGEELRQVLRYEREAPGDLVHVDIKKLGRIAAAVRYHARRHGRPLQTILQC